jgi:hypothetical protein
VPNHLSVHRSGWSVCLPICLPYIHWESVSSLYHSVGQCVCLPIRLPTMRKVSMSSRLSASHSLGKCVHPIYHSMGQSVRPSVCLQFIGSVYLPNCSPPPIGYVCLPICLLITTYCNCVRPVSWASVSACLSVCLPFSGSVCPLF